MYIVMRKYKKDLIMMMIINDREIQMLKFL